MIVSKEKLADTVEKTIELEKTVQKLEAENAELKRGKEAVEKHYKELELRCEELEDMIDIYQRDSAISNAKMSNLIKLVYKYRELFEDYVAEDD